MDGFDTIRQWRTLDIAALRAHPWLRLAPDAAFLVPLTLLEKFSSGRGQEGATTDLGDGTLSQVPLDEVWQDIKREGMRDPLVLAIGLGPGCATIRLESGNHRIWPARKDGLTHLPAIGLASAQPVLNHGNGDHVFPFDRSGLDRWFEVGGRDPNLFEPYPHPVDLVAALSPYQGTAPVMRLGETHTVPDEMSGLVLF